MSRFDEFPKGMAEFQGSVTDGVGLSAKDFPSLHSSASKFGGASASTSAPIPPVSTGAAAASSSLHVSSPSPNACWSSLFPSEKAAKLQYHKPQMANDTTSIFIPKSIHNLGFSVWEDCLVGQFLGGSQAFSQIQAVVRQIWGR